MTPLAPGGQNGGAGLVATSLVREVSRLMPEWELHLLTSSTSNAELAELDASNVHRVCVRDDGAHDSPPRHATSRLKLLARQGLQILPPRVRVGAADAAWRLRHARRNASLMDRLDADLLVCPFTASYFWQANVPLVVIVHDLQHVAYPDFFSVDQRLNRDRHLHDAAARAERVVCVSDFVRQTFQAFTELSHERIVTIKLGLLHEFEPSSSESKTLEDHGLRAGEYLLYPANFWSHKNHSLLFDGLARHRQERGASELKLVCTGAPSRTMRALQADAEARLGPNTVVFPGYLPARQFQALLDNCAAVIYPSLYEGFGMPVLEAMARGKPVLCSDRGSLPEVAGSAARYFEPTDPDDIARAIAWLTDDPSAVRSHVERGRARAQTFCDASGMAGKYVDLFAEILAAK